MLKEYDTVKAKNNLSKLILAGTRGAVVMVYNNPILAYEVEFVDEQGDTLDVLTVYPKDIE